MSSMKGKRWWRRRRRRERGRKMGKRRESKEEGHKTELSNNKRIAFIYCLKNEQECIIRVKKFLHLIIQGCEFF